MNHELMILMRDMTLIAWILVGGAKRNYHWKYLREVRSDLRLFKTDDDFSKSVNMSNRNEYWVQFRITHALLLPFFRRTEGVYESSVAKKYAKVVNYLLVASYLLLGLLVWLFTAF